MMLPKVTHVPETASGTVCFGSLLDRAEKLQPVAERIGRIEPTVSWQIIVHDHRNRGIPQTRGQGVQIRHHERGMCLSCRGKRTLDPQMQAHRATFEPHPAAFRQGRRFRNFRQSEQAAIESAGFGFAVFGHRKLDVVQAVDQLEFAFAMSIACPDDESSAREQPDLPGFRPRDRTRPLNASPIPALVLRRPVSRFTPHRAGDGSGRGEETVAD